MEIFKIFGSIFLKNDEADKTLDKVDKKAMGLSKRIGKLGKGVTNAGKTMSTWVSGPILGAGAGLLAMATNAGNAADRLLDLQAMTGMSTDAIQEYQHVAKIAGVETEAITKAAEGFIRKLPTLTEGNSVAAQSFKEMGIDMTQTSDKIMDDVLMALGKIEDPLEQSSKGAQIFGGAWKDISPVLALGADGIAAAKKEANDLGLVLSNESLNSANNFRIEMDKLKASFGAAFTKIGAELVPVLSDTLVPLIQEKVIPGIQTFIEKVSSVIEWFTSLDGKTQTIILTIAGLLAALGPILIVVGNIITLVSTLTPLFSALGAVFTFLTGPIGLIILGIAALITAGVLLYKNWDKVKEFLMNMWTAIKDFFMETWNTVKDFYIELWEEIKTKVIDVWDSISEFFYDTWNWIKDTATDIYDGIKKFFSDTWDSIKDTIFKVWDGIKSSLKLTWETIKNLAIIAFDAIVTFLDNWGIIKTVTGIIDGLKKAFNGIITFFKGVFKGDWQMAWNGIKDVVTGIFSSIQSSAKGFVNIIIKYFNKLIGSMNKLKFDIPDWVPSLGGKEFALNIPKIPELAKGGNIVGSGRVMVGENGPEYLDLPRGARVTPLDKAGGIIININNPHLFNERDADKLGKLIVGRLRTATGLKI